MILIFLSLLVSPLFAKVPLWSMDKLSEDFKDKIAPIPVKIDELSSNFKSSSYQLQRFDLDLSVSAGLGVQLFSKEIEKGIELVWVRKDSRNVEKNEREVTIGASADDIAQQMLPEVIRVLTELNANNKFRERAIKTIHKDALKFTRFVRALQTFNGQETWYVANYFKNYYFSASGKLLENGFKYDKRLRFRFRTPSPVVLPEVNKTYEKYVHRRLRKMARHLLSVQSLDRPENRFAMSRARTVEGLEGNVDFRFGEVSAAKGIVLEWLAVPQLHFKSIFSSTYSPGHLRSLVNSIESTVSDTKNFKLSQIRIKGSRESELSFLFLSFSKFREIEYHYRVK